MKGNKRILSVVMAVLMLFTTFFTQVGIAGAYQAPISQSTMTKLLQKLKSTKPASTNIKDVDARRALAQKFGSQVNDEGVVSNPQDQVNPEQSVRIIVEVNSQTSLNNVKSSAAKYGSVRHTFTSSFSMNVKFKDIEAVRRMSGVKSVEVANVYYPEINSATNITNAQKVWQDLGLKGEGTVVAIVDTGIDYRHKDMKLTDASKAKLSQDDIAEGSLGKFFTNKVPYGYNFADDNQDVIDRTDSMHGMHVAGIVAANGNSEDIAKDPTSAVKGVAPEAQLLAMKVFSNDPDNAGAFNDDIAAAIRDSIAHGADVINMSLGSTAGFVNYNDPEQAAIREATDAGVVVVVSGGNSAYATKDYYYPYYFDADMGLVGSPGLFPDTLQVASSENTTVIASGMDYSGPESGTIPYSISEIDPFGVLKGQYELVECGIGNPSDFAGKNLTGKIALIKRGTLDFVTKKLNAQAAGATGVIVYNQSAAERADGGDGLINMATDSKVKIPSIFVGNTSGVKLKSLISNGVKVSFAGKKVTIPNPSALKMSDFSSWGTTPGLEFKPEVTAPGGNIYSTVNDNKYEVMSGTSMASPHTAGVTALVVQNLRKQGVTKTGRELVELAKKLIINTAEPIIDPAVKLPYLTRNQGAGLVKVDKAILTKALVTGGDGKATIALKEIGNTTEFTFVIENLGNDELKFNVKDKYGVLTNALQSGYFLKPNAGLFPGAGLAFDKSEVVVPAKEKVEVKATLTIPEGTEPNIFAEGFITLESLTTGQPNLGVPYMGFFGQWDGQDGPRMFDAPMWDADNTFYGLTTVLGTAMTSEGLDYYYLGQTGEDSYGNPVIDTRYLSFSPNDDEIFDGVLPLVSFMRNAKEFKVQVANSEGKVVRDVSIDSNIRKNYTDRQSFFARYSSDWIWDGMILDPATNQMVVAPEGSYKLKLTGTPDFENAEPYVLEMPVKLDNTPPELRITSKPEITDLNQYKLTWSGNDNVGIQQYLVFDFANTNDLNDIINDEVPVPEPVELDGHTEELNLNLSDGQHILFVLASDYAGNESISLTFVDNNLVKILADDNTLTKETELTVNYQLDDRIKYFTDHVDVVVDKNEAINNAMDTSIKLENLSHGSHTVTVKAVDKDGKVLGEDSIKVTVDIVSPVVTTNIASGDNVDTKILHITGSVNEPVKYVNIGGENITSDLFDKDGNFEVDINFINDGVQNVNLVAEDLAGNITEYAYKLFVDTEAPVITLDDPSAEASSKVFVNSDKYTLKFNVSDNVLGYRLYVNGNQIDYVEDGEWDGVDKDYTYIVTNLPLGKSTTTIRVVDMVGHESISNINFYRTVEPVIFTDLTDGQTVLGRNFEVTGRVDYHRDITSFTVNGEVVSLGEDGSFVASVNFEDYNDQKITFAAEGLDENGNTVASTKEVNVKLVPVQLERNDVLTNLEEPFAFMFIADGMYTVTATIDGEEADFYYDSFSYELEEANSSVLYFGELNLSNIPDGPHRVELQFNRGDELVWTETINVAIDTTAPVATVVGLEGKKFNTPELPVSGTVNENVKSVKVNGYVADLEGNNWSVEVPAQAQGANTLDIKTEDFAGNISQVSYKVFVDTIKPVITITSPADKAQLKADKVTVNGKVTDASLVTVKVNGVNATVDGTGNYTCEIPFASYGSQKITVIATDEFGNAASKAINITNAPYLKGISVTADKTELERGQAAVFTAEATYSDGSKADVTNTAEWLTEKGTIVKGAFTAPVDFSGDVKVTAKLENVEGTATINVKVPTVVKVDITSTYTGLLVGKTAELKAVATYSDGTTKDVTSEVTFAVSNTAVAKVQGKVLTALAAGETKVSVTLDGVKSNEITVKVEKPVVVLKNLIQITASKLNVRSGASTRYSILGTLVKGQIVEYFGLVNGWYKIVFNGKTGYISAAYAKVVQQSPAPAPTTTLKKVTVTITSLNVRKGPGTSYAIIGSLKKGTVVTVLGTSGSWYKISYNGQTGYISSTYAK